MLPSVFTFEDIDFSKTVFSKPISHFFSIQLSIGVARKQALLTHVGNATFDTMCDVILFHAQSTAPFGLPKRTLSLCSNFSIPLFWNLPINHTITLSYNTPLPLDSRELQNALDDLGCVDLYWLTKNPLLDLWLQANCQEPETFVLIEESFFSLNEAETLQEYCIDVNISRMLIHRLTPIETETSPPHRHYS